MIIKKFVVELQSFDKNIFMYRITTEKFLDLAKY